MILIHAHQMAIVVLAVVIFLFDNPREKRSVPLTEQSGTAVPRHTAWKSPSDRHTHPCA